MDDNYDLNSAILAAQNGKIHEWVLSFLRSSGNNLKLANRLEKDGQYYLGPISYPLDKVVNIIGHDDTFKFQEDIEILKNRASNMINSMKKGWQPPPLIIANLWDDNLEIADGGHRQRAIMEFGLKEYPMIFYFRDKETMNDFIENGLAGNINLEVADFFGIKPLKYKVKIFDSREDLASNWSDRNDGKDAPDWVVASADFNNTVYILSPKIMPASFDKTGELRFCRTIKHELSHNYVCSINKNVPSWLNEGVCLYVADQNYKPVGLDKITILLLDELYKAPTDGLIYQIGKTMVDQIVNNFGKKRLLEIIAIQDKNDLYSELKQMFDWLK